MVFLSKMKIVPLKIRSQRIKIKRINITLNNQTLLLFKTYYNYLTIIINLIKIWRRKTIEFLKQKPKCKI